VRYANSIPYGVNETLTATDAFGPGSTYGSMWVNSIFSMVAVNADISTFYYSGEPGADGSGEKRLTPVGPPDQNGYYVGLIGTEYDGYFDGDATWFQTASAIGSEARSNFNEIIPDYAVGDSVVVSGIVSLSGSDSLNGIYTRDKDRPFENGFAVYYKKNNRAGSSNIYYWDRIFWFDDAWRIYSKDIDGGRDQNTCFANDETAYPWDAEGWYTDSAYYEGTPVLTQLPVPRTGHATSWEWVGYFKPLSGADFNFSLQADELAYMWIGETANTGYSTENATLSSEGGGYNTTAEPITLVSGTYYPVRIQYGHPNQPTNNGLTISANPNNRESDDFQYGALFNGNESGVAQRDAKYATATEAGAHRFRRLVSLGYV
jgi:hypothetical protein